MAQLKDAKLKEANLEGALNLLIDQLFYVKTLYNTKLDKELLTSLTGVSTFLHKTASKDTFFVGSNKKLIMLIKIPKVLILNSNI